MKFQTSKILNVIVSGLAGGVVWMLSIFIFFGPTQAILANPDYQSAKFLLVMTELEPYPRVSDSIWILVTGVLIICILYALVYRTIRKALAGNWRKKGMKFGLIAWALMVPWFEFYLPWNVMHEPTLLVLLEMILWLAVMLSVGMTIAGVYEWKRKEDAVY